MRLWIARFFKDLEHKTLSRTAYLRARTGNKASEIASAAMTPNELSVEFARVILKPGLTVPAGALLNEEVGAGRKAKKKSRADRKTRSKKEQ